MHLDLSQEEVTTLEQRTEGWIAGLQLAAIAIQSILKGTQPFRFDRPELASFIQAFGGSHRHVVDYLTGEVLQRQPADVQAFLLQTSILERLSVSLCDEVLESSGLSGNARIPGTCQPIPRSPGYRTALVSLSLSVGRNAAGPPEGREHPELIQQIHRRASAWFEQQGFPSEAITHALRSGDTERAAGLLEPLAKSMVLRGESSALLNWLDKLPPEIIASRPELIIVESLGLDHQWPT